MVERERTDPNAGEPARARWIRLLTQLGEDCALWLILWSVLGVFRLLMVWRFRHEIQVGQGMDVFRMALVGARFDSMVASYGVIPSFVGSIGCYFWPWERWARRVRRLSGTIALLATVIIGSITFVYFQEFHDQFNQRIFGLYTDDTSSVARTIWRQYPVIVYVFAWAGVAVLCWSIFPIGLRLSRVFGLTRLVGVNPIVRWIVVIIGIALWIEAFRGWGGRRPIKQRDLSATVDPVLNRLVANPYVALRYAILDRQYVSSAAGIATFLRSQSMAEAARRHFPKTPPTSDLDELSVRTAVGSVTPKPRHIFLIVGESFDGWAMLPEYRELGLANELSRLGENGIWVRAFLPAGGATVDAMGTLVSGLPEVDVNVTYQPSAAQTFATATAPIFKQLGYRTRWFYGGYPSWQRVDEFCHAQGFDEVVGLPAFKNLPAGAVGTWGAYDEFLFQHVLESVPDDVPSFNLILTTSNHPPYDCDVDARGFKLAKLPARFRTIFDQGFARRSYGHLWYTDKCIGEFVRAANARFPQSLFAITGDHPSRRWPKDDVSLFEQNIVPFVLYGPEVLAGVHPGGGLVGGHLDIVPTLVELCAPAGFGYHSLGKNMLAPGNDAIGFGRRMIITPQLIVPSSPDEAAEPLAGVPLADPDVVKDLRLRWEALQALGWWRVMRGSEF